MDEKISKLFLNLLDKLYNIEPAGEPFRKPVDPIKYGCYDYYLYVKHPIDLSTIREKLVSKQYKDAWRFIADIQLMFSNAYLFNKKGTPVYEFTNKLSKIWNSELAPIMQRLNYCCGTLHKFGPQLLFCYGTTPDRYCQIPLGAKYKCYEDSYSFCMPCFNKIESDHISIQVLSCEITRMTLPTQPLKKSDFIDCTNDQWQYETFVQCNQCQRRVHQICDLHPADQDELDQCDQHEKIEEEQRMLCRVPPEFESFAQSSSDATLVTNSTSSTANTSTTSTTSIPLQESVSTESKLGGDSRTRDEGFDLKSQISISTSTATTTTTKAATTSSQEQQQDCQDLKKSQKEKSECRRGVDFSAPVSQASLDDELLQFARDVDDSHSNLWGPGSPNLDENKLRQDSAKELCKDAGSQNSNGGERSVSNSRCSSAYTTCSATSNTKNSVDSIAARLSINKLSAESQSDDVHKINGTPPPLQPTTVAAATTTTTTTPLRRDKFVCNHCYRKKRLGYNLRHRKYSARRLPHTRMSRYIETKVNEHIRENAPSAGEVTIRILTAYRDNVVVKPEMREYLKNCRIKDPTQHPNLEEYPDEFAYTNRAIFAWQEIDGVDVCVFGMHVQEYGEDCPEPNRQVVYLSYLDSVHFFRPKQFRTAVYHEILLSYFKYVKKLGFRRVFIWVCPSRKGDDYIFYRHPTEQKMPTLKRLSDWYIHLLDKGVMAGIVERHQNIYEYGVMENWSSLLSLPYLSGDYWPGEFERLLKIMIESQKKYDEKIAQMQQEMEKTDEMEQDRSTRILDISEISQGLTNGYNVGGNNYNTNPNLEKFNILSLSNLYSRSPGNHGGKMLNTKKKLLSTVGLKPLGRMGTLNSECNVATMATDDSKYFGLPSPNSSRSDDQPLDLSKSSSTTSPESYYDDDLMSETRSKDANNYRRKRRKSSSTLGYTKKRSRISSQFSQGGSSKQSQSSISYDNPAKYLSQSSKSCRPKVSTQALKDLSGGETILKPEDELIKNLERSLKRQKEGFIVVRLTECDCSPHFESQRRKEEVTFTCEMMRGREPFLQLARLKNYEFSTLRRAKFSSLAMVKHLSYTFKLDPICYECFSFDSSKRHYACSYCEDYYLCTSCHENTHHDHIMSLMAPTTLPDINEFLPLCSLASATNSISSASSTISNKSFNDASLELPSSQPLSSTSKKDASPTASPLHRHRANKLGSAATTMPLSCKRQRNHDFSDTRAEDEENANINPFPSNTKLSSLPNQPSPPPSHSSNNERSVNVEFDQVLVDNFIRHAELTYNVDFDEMRSESRKLLTHYWTCPMKDTCSRCKFVVLSCSFMSVLMRSTRVQMMVNCNPNEVPLPSNGTGNNSNHQSGINLTTTPRFKYKPEE